jgi:hypothetical protein
MEQTFNYQVILNGKRNTKEIIDEVQKFGAQMYQIDDSPDDWVIECLPRGVIQNVDGILCTKIFE